MSVNVRQITEPYELGEGPHYDSRVEALYSINILKNQLLKYDTATGKNTSTTIDGIPGFIVPVRGFTDRFIIALDAKFVIVQWDGEDGSPVKVIEELGEVDKDVGIKMRLNDGKADPRGRVYAGTMSFDIENNFPKVGALYRVDKGKITKVEEGIGVSNGLAWDLREKAFYYTDSFEYKIRRYDYDVETGDISNLRYVFDFKENGLADSSPDGFTIDMDGNLWISAFGASCVLQVDPRTGKLLRKVHLPAEQITSATFGGPNLDILYVTTASMTVKNEQHYPAGCTFEVTGLGVKGQLNMTYRP